MTTRRETGHLLRRAGLGARPADFEAFAPLSWEAAVDRLLAFDALPETQPTAPTATGMDPERDEMRMTGPDVITWWLERMVRTERPLEEKLTLFWHDQFATALTKAPPELLALQNVMLRRNALGNFRDLLRAVAIDPAMLLYLDGRSNVAGSPNENFAREFFELHTLGEGMYSEADIKEAARALTGWTIDPRTRTSVFRRQRHDNGSKTVLGQTGNFGLDDIVDIVMEQPAFAEAIAGKVARFFVADDLDASFVRDLGSVFIDNDFEIRPLLEALLKSDAFRNDAYRRQLKGPVDFVVGAVRNLDAQVAPRMLLFGTHGLGQTLFNPPSPAGWEGGVTWVNGNTVLLRANFAKALACGRGERHGFEDGTDRVSIEFDPAALLGAAGAHDAESTVQTFVDLLLDGEIDEADRGILLGYLGSTFEITPQSVDEKVRGLTHLLVASPTYALA